MTISSRTPEGTPNVCPVCGANIWIEPSDPAADAPCPHCGHLLWFTWEATGDAVVIKPRCPVLLSEDFDKLMDTTLVTRGMQLVLDLRGIRYLSSDVLSKLINLKRKVGGLKGKLKIENLHPDLLEVLRIVRLDKVLEIEP